MIGLASSMPAKAKELRKRYDAFAKEAVPPRNKPKAKGFRVPKIWGEPDSGKL